MLYIHLIRIHDTNLVKAVLSTCIWYVYAGMRAKMPRLEDFVYITAVVHWLIPQFFNVVSLNNNTVHTINTPIHTQYMHDHTEFVQCPELATENGEVTISPENRPLNSKATYTCDKGYKVSGPRERYCQLDGTWNGTDTKCGMFLNLCLQIVQLAKSVVCVAYSTIFVHVESIHGIIIRPGIVSQLKYP